jgi:hypothetical protein
MFDLLTTRTTKSTDASRGPGAGEAEPHDRHLGYLVAPNQELATSAILYPGPNRVL